MKRICRTNRHAGATVTALRKIDLYMEILTASFLNHGAEFIIAMEVFQGICCVSRFYLKFVFWAFEKKTAPFY
jgi:hypothetical protein